MPLRSEQVLEIVTLVLVGWMCALGAACIVYVFRFRAKIRGSGRRSVNLRHLRDFNSPWLLRVLLSLLGILWVLLEVFRLPVIRNKGWLLHGIGAQGQRNLCRSYAVISLGIVEPAFFLTALFLMRESLCEEPFSYSRRRWRFRAVLLILLLSLPVFLLQLAFLVITPLFQFSKGYNVNKEGYSHRIPDAFTKSFIMEVISNRPVAACRIPLLSTVTLSVFSVVYVVYFLYLGWKMMLTVINRRLQIRVYSLVLAIVVLVPLHLLLLGLSSSALTTKPTTRHRPVHQVVPFLRFITIAAIVGVGEWVLVLRPISDAMSVLKLSMASIKTGRLDSWGTIPVSLPLSALDEDRTSLITERSVELTSRDNIDLVAESNKSSDDEGV